MWGGTTRDEIRKTQKAKLKTRRDELFDEIRQYKKEYAETISEQEAVEQQIKQGEERRRQLEDYILSEEFTQKGTTRKRSTAGQKEAAKEHVEVEENLADLERRRQAIIERRKEQEEKLRKAREQGYSASEQAKEKNAGINTRKRSAKNIFETPSKIANRLSGGNSALLFGLLAVIAFLWFAITPAYKNTSESRLSLAEKALAGHSSIGGKMS
jgi:chromosome segregation ATPase